MGTGSGADGSGEVVPLSPVGSVSSGSGMNRRCLDLLYRLCAFLKVFARIGVGPLERFKNVCGSCILACNDRLPVAMDKAFNQSI
jgi:hypothetical protein